MNTLSEAHLTPELEQWMAYALLTGHPDDIILAHLAPTGVDPDLLRRRLLELQASPLLPMGRSFAFQLSQARWLLELQKNVSASVLPQQVARIRADEVERFLEDFLAVSRPVIVEGLVDDWPALTCWTQRELTDRLGHEQIEYTRYQVRSNRHEPENAQASFRDFLGLVYDESFKESIYWTAYNQDDQGSELTRSLLADIVFPPDYCLPQDDLKTYFWIGPEGTRSGLHFDPFNVLFVQVVGWKRFLLLPPQEIPNAYLENDYFSQVDGEHPDLELFPKFANCQAMTVEVGPGEALLIPVGWLHQVRSLSVSMSVSLTCLKLPFGKNAFSAPSEFQGIL